MCVYVCGVCGVCIYVCVLYIYVCVCVCVCIYIYNIWNNLVDIDYLFIKYLI